LWLAKAREDWLAAEVILGASMPSYDAVGFHAQQAAEKAVKALLTRHQVKFRKTHDLTELLELAEPVAPGIRQRLADLRALTPYAVDARYPSEEATLDRVEAARHLATARIALDYVDGILRPYLDAGRPGG
jgi:HEPN domain-containing protein